MKTQLIKKNNIFNVVEATLISLPTPLNISYLWNLGSLLSVVLIIQIFSGVILASSYSARIANSFDLVRLFIESNDKAWLIRYAHSNGASLFLIFMYMHIRRGLYYRSFSYSHTWNAGVLLLILSIAVAFIGYVLPVNQISFWGASVITNLFSEIPYIGPQIILLIWGSTSVSTPTLIRFFTFHFLIPFIILIFVVIHITLLHVTGSNNPLGLPSQMDKIMFNKYFSIKDMFGLTLAALLFFYLIIFYPLILGDNDNFTMANPIVTPHHIQPEWYFLFAYAVLRSIPNKLGGVIALLLAVIILFLPPITFNRKIKRISFYPVNKSLFWLFIANLFVLSWVGACPVEEPYFSIGQLSAILYFLYFITNPLLSKLDFK